MDNPFQNFKGEHPPQEQFLLYVDGELALKESALWQSHLEACWSCRVRVGKIEETIADIIEFEETISRFQASRPSQNWGNFDSRLEKLAQETRKKSIKSRLFDFWKQIEQFRSFNQAGKLASVGLALLLVFAIVYQFVFVPPVSAGELLEKAAVAQQEKLKGTNQPVVYQKLKITEQEKSAVLEVWNEVATAKNKKFPGVNGNDEDAGILDEYEAAMTRNGFDALKPLSSEIYQLWRNRSTDKNERVSQTKLADGANGFELTTIIGEPREIGEITQASLIVRQTDWHIISQSIQIKTESGDKIFEVSELEFYVLNRDTLAENFFDNIPISNEIASNTKPTPNASPNQNPSPAPSAETL
ncbi:MAG: hypothetical protein M3Q33_13205, partial [Acidobacteriota bacterium]|nr:hypothetical protein [Acidobacteriota bacterium]